MEWIYHQQQKQRTKKVEKASTSAAETGSQSQAAPANQMMANSTTAMLEALRQVKGESNKNTKITPHAKTAEIFFSWSKFPISVIPTDTIHRSCQNSGGWAKGISCYIARSTCI